MPPLSLPCSSPPASPPSGRSAPAVDPCAAVLGALVTGALRLGDVATLPPDLLPGELYPVVVQLLAAIAESGRPTVGIRRADAERAFAAAVSSADLAGELMAMGRAAPKRGEALRALDACRAAWLHDVLEDTPTLRASIAAEFGEDVAAIVWAVTGAPYGTKLPRKARVADAYAKIVELPKAVFLKLADRIANVEASPVGTHWRPMYAAEQPGFEAMIVRARMADHPLVKRMLDRLRAALDGGSAR